MKEENEVLDRLEKFERGSEGIKNLSSFTVFRNDFKLLSSQLGRKGFDFINRYFNRKNSRHVLVSSGEAEDIDKLTGKDYKLLLSIKPINNLISINEFFEAINYKLEKDGTFICRFTPQERVERRILTKYFFPINHMVYLGYFLFRRVCPKLSITRRFYFKLTKGRNRSLRKLEILGRLIACGYEPVKEYYTGEHVYLVAKKQKTPFVDKYSSYGLLFKMRRIGKGGKEILVYKLRTMVPFSEYLQAHFLKTNRLAKGGKIRNDSRITPLGKWLRKFWIDEIPNLVNLLKGEMKLVGVRPISRQYFSLYDKELQYLRKLVKPGVIPPFYADLPETLDEIQESEKRYIKSYLKKPLQTDIKYLFLAVKNILIKRVCSK